MSELPLLTGFVKACPTPAGNGCAHQFGPVAAAGIGQPLTTAAIQNPNLATPLGWYFACHYYRREVEVHPYHPEREHVQGQYVESFGQTNRHAGAA
jgi:hypothetical protein